MKYFFLLFLLSTSTSFAINYKLSCAENLNIAELTTQLTLKNLYSKPENADVDICFKEQTQSYAAPAYPAPYPSFNLGYGRHFGHRLGRHNRYGSFASIAFDPFMLGNHYYNNYYNNDTVRTVRILSLIIKDKQEHKIWQDSYRDRSNTNSNETARVLLNRIPVSLILNINGTSQMNAHLDKTLPSNKYAFDFEKKRLSPEEFEKIRLH